MTVVNKISEINAIDAVSKSATGWRQIQVMLLDEAVLSPRNSKLQAEAQPSFAADPLKVQDKRKVVARQSSSHMCTHFSAACTAVHNINHYLHKLPFLEKSRPTFIFLIYAYPATT